jgi:hypothetical protein
MRDLSYIRELWKTGTITVLCFLSENFGGLIDGFQIWEDRG